MIPYSATDVLRVMQYELTPEPARTLGNRLATDVSSDEHRDDDRDTNGGGGKLIRLIFQRSPSPTAA